jgi:hypothetical protein
MAKVRKNSRANYLLCIFIPYPLFLSFTPFVRLSPSLLYPILLFHHFQLGATIKNINRATIWVISRSITHIRDTSKSYLPVAALVKKNILPSNVFTENFYAYVIVTKRTSTHAHVSKHETGIYIKKQWLTILARITSKKNVAVTFEVLKEVKMTMLFLWVMTPCRLVDWYQRFGETLVST